MSDDTNAGTPAPAQLTPKQAWDKALDDMVAKTEQEAASGNEQAKAVLDRVREEAKALKEIDPEKLPKGKRLDEILEPGKPTLLECGSGGAALSMAKEAAIMTDEDVDPTVIDVDKFIVPDVDAFNAEWDRSGPFVIVSEPKRATPEVRQRVAEVMCDPTKRVIVCGEVTDSKKPLSGLEPAVFTGAGGHFVRF